ncbi:BZ3500_MvSof-1268-A1-R1_Chr3-1g05420 [Microbotryum saponariae]|uniref:BZ3500_MvSof-1268-A1-R1_Chr3-1g05420 protein n=1 Tax=Microbotryum saponariae TaxID=289078 RepID=A0A2X0LCL4_9BASI|nr:BZ3500_MvSof-1268-A1-R1_Chr3-1g05420 [Microbotryum saponariae]SDA04611.1 BZ3501_MvSof-1269-A2-R1_Chr3-1g05091 [Microbotryum saponariae]
MVFQFIKTVGTLSSLVALAQAGPSYSAPYFLPSIDSNANLTTVFSATGAPGIFNSSTTPDNIYGTYNWCNMPHARKTEYVKPGNGWSLQYVEVVQRHHKRTPYSSNLWPVENGNWTCPGNHLAMGLAPTSAAQPNAPVSWNVYQDSNNPFTTPTGATSGFVGSDCQFPQITDQGLTDSFTHGSDLAGVYRDMLGFLPKQLDPTKHTFRVTNNVITSEVLGGLVMGLFPTTPASGIAAAVQNSASDSLEPTISCPYANTILATYLSSSNSTWTNHLQKASSLYSRLDAVSGVDPNNGGWHQSFDHYYDNLSAKLCHGKPMGCKVGDPSTCVNSADAETVFRIGQYEYFYKFRSAPQSATYSTLLIAAFLQELRSHLQAGVQGGYRHNVAHDGSMSLLLGAFQVDKMVWPGMGSELIFELYNNKYDRQAIRILWGGKPLVTSGPLGTIDMVDVRRFYQYLSDQLPTNLVTACAN